MAQLPITVCRVDTPDGSKDYVTCLPRKQVFARVWPRRQSSASLLRPLEPGEATTPTVFAPNRVFVDFLHGVIARRGTELPGLTAEAKRQGDGRVYVIDQRTRTRKGPSRPRMLSARSRLGGLTRPA